MCSIFNKCFCCAGKCCCFCICVPFALCGIKKKSYAKIGYVMFSFFWVLFAFSLLFTAKEVFEWTKDYIDCPEGGTSCFGTSASFRMSFVLMLFHIGILILILPRAKWSAYIHDGLWVFKFLAVFSAFLITFFIPNSFFRAYGWFALVISFFFLVFQGVMIIGFSYTVNSALLGNEESDRSYLGVLLLLAIIFGSISLLFTILKFVWFHDCWANNLLILVPVGFCVVYIVLVILKTRESASLFTSSVIVTYLVYLGWSGLQQRPTESCNELFRDETATVFQVLLALGITFTVLILLASGVKSNDDPENKFNKALEEDDDESQVSEDNEKGEKQESQVYPVSQASIIFHSFMIVVSIYYCMLISNWGRPTIDDDDYDYFIDEWAGFWVKIIAQWTVGGLYTFSLLAPKIFKNREFN